MLLALYMGVKERPEINRSLCEIGASFGLVLIVYSVFWYDESTPFPSVYALAPVLGTASIIFFTRQKTWVTRGLSWPPFIKIGLISYSAYLWHQPILAFARIRLNGDLSGGTILILLLFTFCMAWLSWRFIEMPARNGLQINRHNILKLSASVCVFFAMLGGLGWSQIILNRETSAVAYIEKWRSSISPARTKCHATKSNLISPEDACQLGPKRAQEVYVWADSHGVELSWELSKLLSAEDQSVRQLTASQCIPVPNVKSKRENHCLEYNAQAAEYLATRAPPSVVVLFARWALYFNGSRVETTEGCRELGAPGPRFPVGWAGVSDQSRMLELASQLEKNINSLIDAGHRVVLIHSMPEPGCNVPEKIAHLSEKHETGQREFISSPYAVHKLRTLPFNKYFQYKNANFIEVKPEEIFCDQIELGRCMQESDLGPYYFDNNHPNLVGSNIIAQAVLTTLKNNGWLKNGAR